uniref:Uncharacterized protein n=1 Tax=Timema cristinae TaxID=61476 RepID=A0A7R9GZY1_TIMCR|nr:unnamed protein product [Timema cristinae]
MEGKVKEEIVDIKEHVFVKQELQMKSHPPEDLNDNVKNETPNQQIYNIKIQSLLDAFLPIKQKYKVEPVSSEVKDEIMNTNIKKRLIKVKTCRASCSEDRCWVNIPSSLTLTTDLAVSAGHNCFQAPTGATVEVKPVIAPPPLERICLFLNRYALQNVLDSESKSCKANDNTKCNMSRHAQDKMEP